MTFGHVVCHIFSLSIAKKETFFAWSVDGFVTFVVLFRLFQVGTCERERKWLHLLLVVYQLKIGHKVVTRCFYRSWKILAERVKLWIQEIQRILVAIQIAGRLSNDQSAAGITRLFDLFTNSVVDLVGWHFWAVRTDRVRHLLRTKVRRKGGLFVRFPQWMGAWFKCHQILLRDKRLGGISEVGELF